MLQQFAAAVSQSGQLDLIVMAGRAERLQIQTKTTSGQATFTFGKCLEISLGKVK